MSQSLRGDESLKNEYRSMILGGYMQTLDQLATNLTLEEPSSKTAIRIVHSSGFSLYELVFCPSPNGTDILYWRIGISDNVNFGGMRGGKIKNLFGIDGMKVLNEIIKDDDFWNNPPQDTGEPMDDGEKIIFSRWSKGEVDSVVFYGSEMISNPDAKQVFSLSNILLNQIKEQTK